MAEWWELSGSSSTEDGAGRAAVRGQTDQIGAYELEASCVTACHLSAASVTSEKASTNLLTRSLSVVTPDPALTSTSIGSTAYVLWKPIVPVQLENIYAVPLTGWAAVTCGAETITVWSTNGGTIGTWTATATDVGAVGVPIAFTLASTGLTLASANALLLNIVATTCSNIPAHSFQIDYTTTA